jgi:hypothetical protein
VALRNTLATLTGRCRQGGVAWLHALNVHFLLLDTSYIMARKRSTNPATPTLVAKPAHTPPSVVFPELSNKEYLDCTELIPDQILLIDVGLLLLFKLCCLSSDEKARIS